MLLFHALPQAPDLYPDHRNSLRFYCLPDTVVPMLDDRGVPRCLLLRYTGALERQSHGFFQLHAKLLRSGYTELLSLLPYGATIEPAVVVAPQVRLMLRGEDAETVVASGPWHALSDIGEDGLRLHWALSAQEEGLLASLHSSRNNANGATVCLEFSAEIHGLQPGLPWQVRADAQRLLQLLPTATPDQACSEATLRAAWLSLPPDLLHFSEHQPTHSAIKTPALTLALQEQAVRTALATLYRPVQGGLAMRAEAWPHAEGAQVSWSLMALHERQQLLRLRWAMSDWYRRWHADSRLFPVIRPVQPAKLVTLQVVQTLTMHPHGLTQLMLTLRYRDPLGEDVQETIGLQPGQLAWHKEVLCPAFGEGLALASKLTCYIAQPLGFPRVWHADADFVPVDDSGVITLDEARARLHMLAISANRSVWLHAAKVRCELWQRQSTDPGAWQVLRQHELSAETSDLVWVLTADEWAGHETSQSVSDWRLVVTALHANGAQHVLIDEAPQHERWVLDGRVLEPIEPDCLTIRASPELLATLEFLAVEVCPVDAASGVQQGRIVTLHDDQPQTCQVWRASLLEAPRYQWRLRWVGRREDGSSLPMRMSAWQPAETLELHVQTLLPQVMTL